MRSFMFVAVALCLNGLTVGPMKSLGVFFIQFQNHLDATAGESSLVISLLYGAFFMSGPVASILANRFGYRQTLVTGATMAALGGVACSFSPNMVVVDLSIGVVTGTGCGLVTVPTLALMGIKFKEKRSFVNNIVTTGSAIAAIPLSPLVQYWIDNYGWRGAFLLLGGVLMNAIPMCLFLVSPQTNSEITPQNRKLIDLELLKSPTFIMYAIACGCQMASMVAITVYLVRFAQERGVDDYIAASLSSVMSVVDLSLRVVTGYITTLSHIGPIPVRRSYFFSGVMCIQAIVVAMFPAATSVYSIVAVTVSYSICIGCCGALPITILSDLFGADKLITSLGLRAMVVGAASITTPPLVGKIVDATGSYNAPFYVSSGLAFTSAALVTTVQVILLNTEERTKQATKDSAKPKHRNTSEGEMSPISCHGTTQSYRTG